MEEIIVTGIPILGESSTKGKLIDKMADDCIGNTREGGRISRRDYEYETENEKKKVIRFLFFEVSHKNSFINMRKALYKSTKASIAIFEFPRRESLENMPEYVKELCEFSENEVSLGLIGHSVNLIKKDLSEVSIDMVKEYKERIKKEVGEEKFFYQEIPSFHEDFSDYFNFLAKEVLKKMANVNKEK